MALAGLKKQFNKANQYVSEKMGATEGTKLDEDYTAMERKTDGLVDLVDDLLNRTKEYLQPNPTTRAKIILGSKVMQTKTHAYPQPEGILGDSMIRASQRIGDDAYALSLNEMGEALKQMAEVKYALEDNVKQNFLEPLNQLQSKQVRDVQHHRKKLESRRLDFDAKRRRAAGTFATSPDIKMAEEKFEESYNNASMGMHNLLSNETEHISLLAALAEALYEYHSQSASILESLTSRLIEQKEMAASKAPPEFKKKTLAELHLRSSSEDMGPVKPTQFNGSNSFKPTFYSSSSAPITSPTPPKVSPNGSPTKPPSSFADLSSSASNGSRSHNASPLPSPVRSPVRVPKTAANSKNPSCQALYDFEAENPGELAFKEGDIITLTGRIDENWFQGTFSGKTGIFPVTYVHVLVPLP